MATATENALILDKYLNTGGDLGPVSNLSPAINQAMAELVGGAVWDYGTRRLFAGFRIFERVLNPPSLMPTTFVRPSLQIKMLSRIYDSVTGGFWTPPDPAGITTWLGSEAGGRNYFIAALSDSPRIVDGLEVHLGGEALALMLKIVRDAALPVSWFAPLMDRDVFKKLEVRVSASSEGPTMRRALLALIGQASGRVSAELAKLASADVSSFPTYPTGEGGASATVPPPAKRWYRNGWVLITAGVGAVGGGVLAARR